MDNPIPAKRERFWKRQFSDTITGRQKIFDVTVGAIIPILLLIFDPTVFRGGLGCGEAVLGGYAIFAYLAIGLGILALIGWLFVDSLKHNSTAFIAGILGAGGFFAAGVGIVIAPFSVLGLMVLIGALGFLPFFTSFVYFRNATRAFRVAAALSANKTRRIVSFVAGLLLVIGLPALAQVEISSIVQHSIDKITATPNASSETAITELKTVNQLCVTLCTSTIATAFDKATVAHSDQRTRLTAIYQEITGTYLVSSSCSSD